MIEIIPTIDIIGGRCVRLEKGDFSRSVEYDRDPLDAARRFEDAGINRLHMVDLDGARSGRIANLEVLERVAHSTGLEIDFSGGIKTRDDVMAVFSAGAAYAAIGSMSIKEPATVGSWLEEFGPQRFLLGADVRGRKLAVSGWQEQTDTDLLDHLHSYFERGVDQVFVTDIARDGMLEGPSIELYRTVLAELPRLKLIASGGVSQMSDIDALAEAGCSGVIIGKALYENRIRPAELSKYVG